MRDKTHLECLLSKRESVSKVFLLLLVKDVLNLLGHQSLLSNMWNYIACLGIQCGGLCVLIKQNLWRASGIHACGRGRSNWNAIIINGQWNALFPLPGWIEKYVICITGSTKVSELDGMQRFPHSVIVKVLHLNKNFSIYILYSTLRIFLNVSCTNLRSEHTN